jgi:HEAT repeat protein
MDWLRKGMSEQTERRQNMLWQILRQLKSKLITKNSMLREQAVEELGELKDTRAIGPQVEALKDNYIDV